MEDDEWEALESPWQIESVPSDHHSLSRRESASASSEILEDSPESPLPSSSASSSPTPPPSESPPAANSSPAREAAARLRLRLWAARRAASDAIGAWRLWIFAAAAAGATAVVFLYYRRLRSQWRRRSPAIRDDSRDRLAVVLREKDEVS